MVKSNTNIWPQNPAKGKPGGNIWPQIFRHHELDTNLSHKYINEMAGIQILLKNPP